MGKGKKTIRTFDGEEHGLSGNITGLKKVRKVVLELRKEGCSVHTTIPIGRDGKPMKNTRTLWVRGGLKDLK